MAYKYSLLISYKDNCPDIYIATELPRDQDDIEPLLQSVLFLSNLSAALVTCKVNGSGVFAADVGDRFSVCDCLGKVSLEVGTAEWDPYTVGCSLRAQDNKHLEKQ